MLKHYLSLILVFLQVFLGACEFKRTTGWEEDSRPKVLCTTGIIADGVSKMLGQEAQVRALMGHGVDPHLYKAGIQDVELLNGADIIISNGLHLEGKLYQLFQKLENRKTIIFLGDGLKKESLRFPEENEHSPDPHIWFDVLLWQQALGNCKEALKLKFPASAHSIEQRYSTYAKELSELDGWIKGELEKIPSDKRVLVTAHDAFGYFGKAYGVEVKGLQGLSTLSDFGIKDVSDLVNFMVKRQIPAIFFESAIPKQSIEAVIEGCKAKKWHLRIGKELYSDALGDSASGADTYIGMVKYNVVAMVEALAGPEKEAAFNENSKPNE